MTSLQFATDTAPGGALISDDSARATTLVYATNTHGFAELRSHIPLPLTDAYGRFDSAGLPHQRLNDGPGVIYEGRREDLALTGDGVSGTALGYSRALSDAPYTALWSSTDLSLWRPFNEQDNALAVPSRFQMDLNNRVFLAPQKGATYANAGANFVVGAYLFQIPDSSTRQIVGISFDYIINMPANWVIRLVRLSSPSGAGTVLWTVNGGAGVTPGARYQTLTADTCLLLQIFYNAAAAAFAGETGSSFASFTNVRVVTATTNAVNTTTTVARGAGVNVTDTVGSTARMYVGQRLQIGASGAGIGETVVVKSITNTTQYIADFTAAAAIGVTVQAFVIYADEIVKDIVGAVSTLNPTQLSSSTVLVQSPGLDLFDELCQDQYPSDILSRLITLGDSQATPRQWEWAIWENRQLIYQPRGATARTWYIDLAQPEIERTLNALANSVYADYQDANGRTLRTAASTDASSVARYAITRRTMLSVSSASAAQAAFQVSASLSDTKDPIPRARLTTDAIFDQNGARWPLTVVRANDIVVIRNLPPTLGTSIDRIRTFRIIRTELDLMTNVLTMEPESPLPTLAAMLARAVAPSWVTAPWWVQIRQR